MGLATDGVGSAGLRQLMGKGVAECMVARPDPARLSEIKTRSNTGVLPVRKRPNVAGFKSYCGSHARRLLMLCDRAARPGYDEMSGPKS